MFAVPQEMKIITVTKLNRFAKQVLESEIGQVWVSGEISNFTRAASGHWYFTLKDNNAQVRTAMFKGANQKLSFTPKHGDKVIVRANISLYEARGDYQLIAMSMEPEGLGKLKQAFEALKAQLNEEGLFAQETKQSLPTNIAKIGVVTSPTGAAVHDILHVLQRRNPAIEVIIYPSMVQGDGAANTVAEQIVKANERNEVDVLVVGRGGGSLEDLFAFNEEIVARAIFASSLPIVSAVGHEVDVTIADFVADVRAATPSAAAELLSTDRLELTKHLNTRKQMLMRAMLDTQSRSKEKAGGLYSRLLTQHPAKKLEQNNQAFDYLYARLQQQHPSKQINAQKQALAYLEKRLNAQQPSILLAQHQQSLASTHQRLQQAITQKINKAKQIQATQAKAILYLSPDKKIKDEQRKCNELYSDLLNAIKANVDNSQRRLASVSAVLNTVSPLATLSRGYSITMQNDLLLKSVDKVKIDQEVTSKLKDGEIVSKVTKVLRN
jgi:exodeoxyribonuclease VII large subunit